MRHLNYSYLLCAVVLFSILGCGEREQGDVAPKKGGIATQLENANRAFAENRIGDATELYGVLLSPVNREKLTQDQLLQASLNWIRCKIKKGKYKDASMGLGKMETSLQGVVTEKNTYGHIRKDLLEKAVLIFDSKEDDASARLLCEEILRMKWQGEEAKSQRIQAFLCMLRLEIRGQKTEASVKNFKAKCKEFQEHITLDTYQTIIGDLIEHKAPTEAVDLLYLAKEQYPDSREWQKKMAEEIIKLEVSAADLERLKQLGYL